MKCRHISRVSSSFCPLFSQLFSIDRDLDHLFIYFFFNKAEMALFQHLHSSSRKNIPSGMFHKFVGITLHFLCLGKCLEKGGPLKRKVTGETCCLAHSKWANQIFFLVLVTLAINGLQVSDNLCITCMAGHNMLHCFIN